MKSSKKNNNSNNLKKLFKINLPYLKNTESKDKKKTNNKSNFNNIEPLESSGVLELPIKAIIDNKFIIMDDDTLRIIFAVSPLNVDYFDNDDLNAVKDKIISALSAVRSRVGIYIQKEKMNLDAHIENMEKHASTLDNMWQESIQAINIKNLKSSAKNINNVDRFYVALESDNKNHIIAESELEERYGVFSDNFEEAGLFCEQLCKKDILNLLYKRCNPFMSTEIELKEDAEIKDILPNTALIHKEGDILEIEDVLLKHVSFTKFRKSVDEFSWLKNILKLDNSIFIGITLNPKEGDIISKLDKTMNRNVGSTTKRKKFSEEKATETQISGVEEMFDQISDANMVIYDVNITVSIQGFNRQSLDNTYRKLLGVINGYRYEVVKLTRKEFMPFFATLPLLVKNNITQYYTYNLTIDDVAATLPFSSNEYIDENGVVYGKNLNSRSLFILNRKNSRYHNPHLAIIADSGSGKTFAIATFIYRELPYMDYTIVIDLVGVYKKMLPFAENYAFGPHSDIVLNPFFIRGLKERKTNIQNGEEETEHKAPITSKTLDLISFFMWIISDMKSNKIAIIDDLIRRTYEKKNISDDHIPDDLEFPTFSDFYEILCDDIEKATSTKAREIREDIKDEIKPYVKGSMQKVFNGQTNFDYKMGTILDLSRLNKQIQPAAYDLLLNDLWSFGIKDGTNDVGNPPTKSIYIDENHELARKENPQTLDFEATKLQKQGRKYNMFITTATQGLSDYLVIEKYGQAILDNSYFKFFMRLGETDHKVAKELYGFTEKEMKILKSSSNMKTKTKGKGIFSVGGYKIPIQTFAYPSELKHLNKTLYEEQVKKGLIKEED